MPPSRFNSLRTRSTALEWVVIAGCAYAFVAILLFISHTVRGDRNNAPFESSLKKEALKFEDTAINPASSDFVTSTSSIAKSAKPVKLRGLGAVSLPPTNIPAAIETGIDKTETTPDQAEAKERNLPRSPDNKDIISFVEKFLAAENGSNLSESMSKYADRVEYFDDGWVSREFVEKDKSDYRSKWISHQEILKSEIQAENNANGDWIVNYTTRFHVKNVKGDWIEGDADNSLRLALRDNVFSIVYQNVSVHNRTKGTSSSLPSVNNSTSDFSAQIRSFISAFIHVNQTSQIDELLSFYAPKVNYFDHGTVGEDFIRKDIEYYQKRWPIRRDAIEGDIQVGQNEANGHWRAQFTSSFYVESPSRGEWIKGEFSQSFEIASGDNAFKIISVNANTIRREKGKLAAAKITQSSPSQSQGNFSGQWNGAVHPAKSASGMSGSFVLKLQIDSAGSEGNIFVGNEKLASLSTVSLHATQIKMKGYHRFADGQATITVLSGLTGPRTMNVSIRTDTANGGWSVMEGTLNR